ncbi:hypothetical protein BH10BAC4_BH10BAC4_06860 [soil metagenome]
MLKKTRIETINELILNTNNVNLSTSKIYKLIPLRIIIIKSG